MTVSLPVSRGDPVLVVDDSRGAPRELWGVVLARQVRFALVAIWDHEAGAIGEFDERQVRPAKLRRPDSKERSLIIEHFENNGYECNE